METKTTKILDGIYEFLSQKGFWFIIILVFLYFFCYKIAQDEYEPQIEELEDENTELKDKLDNINQMASYRYYDYEDTLDDIEAESYY